MKPITILKLAAVHQACDVAGKSMEYAVQMMQDLCHVSLSVCNDYLMHEHHAKRFKELNELIDIIIKTNDI